MLLWLNFSCHELYASSFLSRKFYASFLLMAVQALNNSILLFYSVMLIPKLTHCYYLAIKLYNKLYGHELVTKELS